MSQPKVWIISSRREVEITSDASDVPAPKPEVKEINTYAAENVGLLEALQEHIDVCKEADGSDVVDIKQMQIVLEDGAVIS